MVDNKEKDKFDLGVKGLKGSKPQNKTPSNVWDKDSLLNYKLQITNLLILSQIHDSYMIQPSQ